MSLPLFKANNCLDNLPICNASCCRSFSVIMPNDPKRGSTVRIPIRDMDSARYYKLHGVRVAHGLGFITVRDYYRSGERIVFRVVCQALGSDNHCMIHATKPLICKSLDWGTAKESRFFLTEGCIFKEAKEEKL